MSDQWRCRRAPAFASPLGGGELRDMHLADTCALAARLGWMPSYLGFDHTARPRRRRLGRGDAGGRLRAARARRGPAALAAEDPDGPGNFPKVLTLWRANLLGSSSKARVLPAPRSRRRERGDPQRRGAARPALEGRRLARRGPERQARPVHDDRLPHERVGPLLGRRPAGGHLVREARPLQHRPAPVRAHVQPGGGAALGDANRLRDLQAARRDLQRAGRPHLGVRTDVVAAPLLHDTPDELAQPLGRVRGGRASASRSRADDACKLVAVERDYGAVYEKWAALGPLVERLGVGVKGVAWTPEPEVADLRERNGAVAGGPGRRAAPARPRPGHVRGDPRPVGRHQRPPRAGLPRHGGAHRRALGRHRRGARRRADHLRRRAGAAAQGAGVAGWSGTEARERRYSPFTINVERGVPWRTLTGRQQLYRPPVDARARRGPAGLPAPIDVLRHVGEQGSGDPDRAEVGCASCHPTASGASTRSSRTTSPC